MRRATVRRPASRPTDATPPQPSNRQANQYPKSTPTLAHGQDAHKTKRDAAAYGARPHASGRFEELQAEAAREPFGIT